VNVILDAVDDKRRAIQVFQDSAEDAMHFGSQQRIAKERLAIFC
jgi:hypothetical protein